MSDTVNSKPVKITIDNGEKTTEYHVSSSYGKALTTILDAAITSKDAIRNVKYMKSRMAELSSDAHVNLVDTN